MAAVSRNLQTVPRWIGSYVAVRDRNVVLEEELRQMRAMVMRARTLSYDNRRLRALLRVRDGITQPVVAARLVNSSASSTRRYATLNAGDRQGVASGMPVRGPDGLLGRVISAGPNTARILLLADPESIVPVRRTRDGMPAFAAGRGDGWLEVRSAAGPMVRFTKGDVFVTSGTGGVFPPGIPVVRIIEPSNDTAIGRTFAQPATIDFALVQRPFVDAPPPPPPTEQPCRPPRRPFDAAPLVFTRRAVPAVSVMLGSLMTTLPVVATFPVMPPFGLMMLLGWRLVRPEAFRIWARCRSGLFDDLVSGQPVGSAIVLWSICFFVIELIDTRLMFRDSGRIG